MKNKAIYIISILMAMVLAACGPSATPTMNPADVQGTAVAAAWTVVAMTQESIPTATPIPPTEVPSPTPLPTFTPLPPPTTSDFPTQPSVFSAPTNIPAGGPTADPCNAPIAESAAGHKVRVDLKNKSSGTAILSLYLAKTEFGECGIYSFRLGQGDNQVSLLEGCYWAGAFIEGPKHRSKAFGNFCISDPSHKWTVTITNEQIGFFD